MPKNLTTNHEQPANGLAAFAHESVNPTSPGARERRALDLTIGWLVLAADALCDASRQNASDLDSPNWSREAKACAQDIARISDFKAPGLVDALQRSALVQALEQLKGIVSRYQSALSTRAARHLSLALLQSHFSELQA